jgi:hypothetical protein
MFLAHCCQYKRKKKTAPELVKRFSFFLFFVFFALEWFVCPNMGAIYIRFCTMEVDNVCARVTYIIMHEREREREKEVIRSRLEILCVCVLSRK